MEQMMVQAKSFAKINLSLEVLGRRADGYHEIRTLFQTVRLHDTLRFYPTPSGKIEIECHPPVLPADAGNLIYRAADLLRQAARVKKGARIILDKIIPIGGGLGGGSSNAAVSLIALNRLWDLGLSDEELMSLARRLGADVTLFLFGGAALGLGRGDELYPFPDMVRCWIVLIYPHIMISTPEAYRDLRRPKLVLTKDGPDNKMQTVCHRLVENPHDFSGLFNDFEAVVFKRYPKIARIKNLLRKQGAAVAQLTGTGSTVFGIFRDKALAEAAVAHMDRRRGLAILTQPLGRSDYKKSAVRWARY
jgi:4-diphosphocytidyl-2-C-methyl-D-erythritol kinase